MRYSGIYSPNSQYRGYATVRYSKLRGFPQMANCCENKSCEIDAMRDSHGRVLWIVFAINTVMFFSALLAY